MTYVSSSLGSLSLLYSAPATLATLLYLKHIRHTPASGPLYLPFLLPVTLFLNIYMTYTFTSFKNLFKCSFFLVNWKFTYLLCISWTSRLLAHWTPHKIFFWPCLMACEILTPQPGIELWAPAKKVSSPNHWTTREFPQMLFFFLV